MCIYVYETIMNPTDKNISYYHCTTPISYKHNKKWKNIIIIIPT